MNNTLFIIGCVKRKYKRNNIYAFELYKKSYLFRLSLEYAKLVSNNILILSAKYGTIKLSDKISYYDDKLEDLSLDKLNDWYRKTYKKLIKYIKNRNINKIVFLCGEKYYLGILEELKIKKINMVFPFKNIRLPFAESNLRKEILKWKIKLVQKLL
jgi:cytoplasmic iron level regulating protein YaaA (DUF328/UPF0246 family)